MGDRGNIEIRQPNTTDSVFLYTHWSGSEVAQTLARALKKFPNRWDDPPYMTRLIFDELVDGDRGETGFGISIGGECDNEHDIPFVNWTGYGDPSIRYKDVTYAPRKFIEKLEA